jgi:hypothetical protein
MAGDAFWPPPLGADHEVVGFRRGFWVDPSHDTNGPRWWTGEKWDDGLRAGAGVYRRWPSARWQWWTGAAWAGKYWTWPRTLLSIGWIVIASVVEVTFVAAMLSDPGPGGYTAEFAEAKDIGAAGFFLWGILATGILCLLNLPIVRAVIRERKARRDDSA